MAVSLPAIMRDVSGCREETTLNAEHKTGVPLRRPTVAKKPMRCVEYVVAHELTHILVRSHNQKFYSILDSHFEDAAELKNLLKRKD